MTGFDLPAMLAKHAGDGPALWAECLNPQMTGVLHARGTGTVWDTAEGRMARDAAGAEYLDLVSGFGVHALGHNHPVPWQAITGLRELAPASMMQMDTPLIAGLLAEALLETAPGLDRAYFCSGGAEAVETALKLARAATGNPRILYLDHAFHGLSYGALSVCGCEEFRRGFGPLLPGTTMVPFGDLDALAAELAGGDVAALIAEPVQGKTLRVLPPGYLAAASGLLHDHGALLICDEVATGLGRTGRFFAYQHENVVPDVVTVAKALSGGLVPAAAVLARDQVFRKTWAGLADVMRHGSTYSAGALAMAAGLAAVHVIKDEDLPANAARQGRLLGKAVTAMAAQHEMLAGIRGQGLMQGIMLAPPRDPGLLAAWDDLTAWGQSLPAQMTVSLLHSRGIITDLAGGNAPLIRIIPPLGITTAEITRFLSALDDALGVMHSGPGPMRAFAEDLARRAGEVTRG